MGWTIPPGDIKSVTAVVGRFVLVYDADGNLIAEPETRRSRTSPRRRVTATA